MRPDSNLAGLLGLGGISGDLSEGYVDIDTTSAPGAGITTESMQFHGTADRWTLNGARSVATLVGTANPVNPAVTLRNVGSAGGQAAAFTYDLARSVVYTRQGNPAFAGQKRDGQSGPIRSDDLFFPDYLDFSKVHIPQADEQQRLLANLVTQMNFDRTPLPRFWYLPRGEKAAFVMTGDDHEAGAGTSVHFDRFRELSAPGCSVADWQCIRGTSYLELDAGLSSSAANTYQAQGFEIALHLDTGCGNFTEESLRANWAQQLPAFRAQWPGVTPPRTNRTHCIAWSDWASEPLVARENGVRLDTNYYYWPGAWVQNRPGMFTGAGFAQRFADVDGSLIDVYQATTQMPDESELSYSTFARALINRALGADGYYGVFTANIHTDRPVGPAEEIIAEAQAAGVPVITAAQLLDWTEGRNSSQFQNVGYGNGLLRFTVAPGAGARGLEAMLPASAANGALNSLTRNGQQVARETRTVKGITYHVFAAAAGNYEGTYGVPGVTPPPDTDPTPGTGGTGAGGAGGTGGTTKPGTGGAGTGGAGGVGGVGGVGGAPAAQAARVRSRTVRVSNTGALKLRVKCSPGESPCRVTLRIRRNGRQIVTRRIVTIAPGATRTVAFKLSRSARLALFSAGSFRADVTATTRSGAASPATTRNRIRLLAPKR